MSNRALLRLASWGLPSLQHTLPNLFRRLFVVEISRQGSNVTVKHSRHERQVAAFDDVD
jgi:hypothetical protein